jgi:membrane associated rhomboid family serine protease
MSPVVVFNVTGAVALTANVPDKIGRTRFGVPAAACGVIVAVPEVFPANPSVPITLVGIPSTGVEV